VSYFLPTAPPSQKILFQLESNIRVSVGCDVNVTNFNADVSLVRTLVSASRLRKLLIHQFWQIRVTAVPALLGKSVDDGCLVLSSLAAGSLYSFAAHYSAAYQDYTRER
jgi:hypothetical protein